MAEPSAASTQEFETFAATNNVAGEMKKKFDALRTDTDANATAIAAIGTTANLASTTPAPVAAAGAAGTDPTAAHADHKHADPMRGAAGANLGDADANLQVSAGNWRKIPASTLGADRTYTLVTTGAVAGDQIDVTRLDVTAHAAIFVNGGGGAGTLYTMAASKLGWARFQFDGTNWALRAFGVQ